MSQRKQRHSPKPRPAAPPARSGPRTIVVAAVCFAAVLALYWGALGHPLVFDDKSIQGDILRFYNESRFSVDRRWLSNATFGWIHDIAGSDWRWQRAANVLLHGAAGVALFLFLARLFELTLPAADPAARPALAPAWIAFFGALIFVLHPAAVYGTAYLVQRSIVLATLFSLISLRLFLEGLVRKAPAWHVAAAFAYLLAVFSKEHCAALPAVAAALAVLVRGPSLRIMLRELALPIALFAAIGLAIVVIIRGFIGAQYEPVAQALLERSHAPGITLDPAAVYPLSVINQGYLFFRYLLTWLIPYPGWMSVDLRVPFPARFVGWPQTFGFLTWLALPVFAALLLRKGGRSGLIGLGLLYPWVLALTEVATVRIQEPFAIYRSYLWMSGLPVLLGPALHRLPARWSVAALSAACVVLIPLSLERLDSFSSQVKLWDDVVRKNAGVPAITLVERGYHNRGLAYLQARRYSDALRDFNRALEINARDLSALVGRGTLLARTGSFESALADLGRAIEIDPTYAEAYGKRCFTKMLLDQPHHALADCQKAVALDPRHRDAYTNLGVVFAALNRTGEAEASYRRALGIDPGNSDANYNYGVLLLVLDRRGEARDYLARACDARITDACDLLEGARRGR